MTRRPWMQAHPKRHDDLRFVLQVVLGLGVLFAACVVYPVPG